ncbi:MAG TPA: polysaccharide biosynthesis/export family protein [Methylomirabilota bacterium]|nr:polysaccharide biosynthesis/export family protein [Methylomirabilota bacterium]
MKLLPSMRSWRVAAVSVLLMLLVGMPGCRTTQEPERLPDIDGPIRSSELLRPGDALLVVYRDIPMPPAPEQEQVQVRDDGSITLHLGQRFQAAGKSLSQLEEDIRDAYVGKFYQRMTVTVHAGDRMFTVDGAVRQPGRFPYQGQMTVLRAITTASGFTDFASRRKVEIIRANGEREFVDCLEARDNPREKDLEIFPGDYIFVPQSVL